MGIHIKYDRSLIRYPQDWNAPLRVFQNLDTNVAILKIFPGITPEVIDAILNMEGLRGVVLETFGSGNAPTADWFVERIKDAVHRGLVVLNVTQCHAGKVDMDAYATGVALKQEGVISGFDSTTEAAVTKMFFALGQSNSSDIVKELLQSNLRGEISI